MVVRLTAQVLVPIKEVRTRPDMDELGFCLAENIYLSTQVIHQYVELLRLSMPPKSKIAAYIFIYI
jgi:hypothetical protein